MFTITHLEVFSFWTGKMANVLFVVVNFFSEKRKPVNIRKGKREKGNKNIRRGHGKLLDRGFL